LTLIFTFASIFAFTFALPFLPLSYLVSITMFALALLLPVVAAVPTSWLQPADAPAASLFKRGVSNSDPDAPGKSPKAVTDMKR
jgi:hypothetical protein